VANAFLREFGKRWMKPLTLLALLLPFAYLAWQWIALYTGQPHEMGFDSVQWTHHYLGNTAIRILLVTLAISPIRDITGWAPIALIRRRIGLAAFFYGMLHLLAYVWLDLNWAMGILWKDLVERLQMSFGILAFTLMVPLAVTSNNASIKKLGRQAWDRLHWLIFLIAILALAHDILMRKVLEQDSIIHGTILALLLGWRLFRWMRGKLRPAAAAA
jgi:methionine sulfoxide reductase heme-binding subunit